METVTPLGEIIEVIKESRGSAFSRCFQCGLCDSLCPWSRVRDFSMRRLVREAAFGLIDIGSEEIWLCTTCGKCPPECPREVKQIESGIALRRIASEYNVFHNTSKPVRTVRGSLSGEGNPFNEKREKRSAWTDGLSVKSFVRGMEILYFPGCYPCYDPRLKKVAQATAKILERAGVSFGILGERENCCGESIRKTGDEEMFIRLAKENIKTFIDHDVKRILVTSPHCYHTFRNEYPEFSAHFEIVHIAQYLFEIVNAGRLEIRGKYPGKVTYHDPCYLGRHNNIFDEPRELLRKIPGLELVEMAESHKNSLCCGGGGGRIWMETPRGQRFSEIRMEQAIQTGAEELVTCCPYCIAMFEESRISMGADDKIRVKDITEIIEEVI
ncbi:MAG: (Fe-S)-binding protein [Deltaproteobacteria bacterium]|nr:(Fe-S)-binding protein [Deltaproteobacteria bacterium]